MIKKFIVFKDNADDNIDINKEFRNLIGTLDSDSDGKINFNEFSLPEIP